MRIRKIWRPRDFEIDYKFPDEKSCWLFSSLVSLMLVFGAGALALFEKEQHKFIILAVRHLSQGTSIPNKYKRKVIKTVCFFDEAVFDSKMAIGFLRFLVQQNTALFSTFRSSVRPSSVTDVTYQLFSIF